VVIGLDRGEGPIAGFNPYSIADFSPAAQATASLVLPSAFVISADGTVTPDADVIDNAQVTSENPFTVTYTLDRKASWSDGTPITAEDFSYLRDQLAVQPGTINPVGYQLITAIRSRDAGKTVDVQFSDSFPDWRTLFSPLLPSHLIKDFPGGWQAALTADIPLSANRYKMTSYDAVTGQVTLARNDKYWGTPPNPAAVILRLGEPDGLLEAFSRGDIQALWLAPGSTTAAALEQSVPEERRAVISTPATVQLVFNAADGATALPAVRTAIALGIDPTPIAADLTDGWLVGADAVSSQVSLPSESNADQAAQKPIAGGDAATATTALAAAGYTNNGLYATRNGEILRLTLGYVSGNPRMAAAARTIQTQLGLIGIEIDLLPEGSQNLVDAQIAVGTMDLALLTVPRGISDAVAAASAFGCPATASAQGIGSTPTSTAAAGSTSPESAGTADVPGDTGTPETAQPESTPAADAPAADPADAATLRTGNLSGYCVAQTQQLLVKAVTGSGPAAAADPPLTVDLPVLPLFQESAVFAVSETLQPVLQGSHEGWMWTGPLVGLPGWPMG
jgi:ABC-type transport system substrate-binding protein